MKVKDLKKLLEDALENLEQYDDETEIDKRENTYMWHPYCYIAISDRDGGYVDLFSPVEEGDEE